MNEHVNHRTPIAATAILATRAAAVIGAIYSSSVIAKPSAPSPLAKRIEEHRKAWAAFEATIDLELTLSPRGNDDEVFVPLTIGGAESGSLDLRWKGECVDGLRNAIRARYDEAAKATGALKNAAPKLHAQARAALRKAHAADLRSMRRAIQERTAHYEATGYAAAWRAYSDASDAEKAALDAVLSYRCVSLEEVAEKAQYLGEVMEGCIPSEDQSRLLIESMRPMPTLA